MKNEYINCKFVCPKCDTHWANVKIEFDKPLDHNKINIIAGKKKKFKRGDTLKCSACSYEYTNWDVNIAIVEAMRNEKTNSQKGENNKPV